MIGSKISTARIMGVKFKLDPNKNYQLEYLINKAIKIKNVVFNFYWYSIYTVDIYLKE